MNNSPTLHGCVIVLLAFLSIILGTAIAVMCAQLEGCPCISCSETER